MSRTLFPAPGRFGRLPFVRLAVLDTETTGLAPFGLKDDGAPTGDPEGPDRMCSLAVRMLARDASGGWVETKSAEWRFDPERTVPEHAARVNGFARVVDGPVPEGRTNLAGMPSFAELADEVMGFIGLAPIACHNVVFDIAVLDAELARAGRGPIDAPVVCTKKAFSDIQGLGRPNAYVPGTNLNKLCDGLGVDRSERLAADGTELHGARIDAGMAARCLILLDAEGWLEVEDPGTLPHRLRAD